MIDILVAMFDDLRRSRPIMESYHEFQPWLEAISQVIAAYPERPDVFRQAACAMLIADDLCVATGKSRDECFFLVWGAVEKKKAVRS